MSVNSEKSISDKAEPLFLLEGGEMANLISNFDWASTSLGKFNNWPPSLLINLANILRSGFPMVLLWGENHICFYNVAYRPSLESYGSHPAIGKQAKDIWPETWGFISGLIQAVYESKQSQYYEDLLIPTTRDGHVHNAYWTFSYSPAYNERGVVEGVLVTCMDTTKAVLLRRKVDETVAERTRQLEVANESITKSNIYLQDIINSSNEPLQVLVPVFEEGKIIDFLFKITNDAYALYTGQNTKVIEGKRVSEFFPGYFKTTSFSNVVKTFETGIKQTWEIHYDQDGLDLYNEMTAIKRGDEVVLHFTDFSKLKHLELELLKKIDELQTSNQNLEAFAHAASHDLKEPVRKIQFFASKLRSGWKGPSHIFDDEALSKIENASERMNNLINDILLFSECHLHPLEQQSVDLNKLVQEVIGDLEVLIQEKKAIITLQPLPVIAGYEKQLQQMFQNLIGNALKYNRESIPPEVVITAGKKNRNGKTYDVIEVMDNGIGFDEQYSEKIFHLFTRLHGNSSYSGSGIGLSIVKKVVDIHHGEIEVESSPGEGASFRVYFVSEPFQVA